MTNEKQSVQQAEQYVFSLGKKGREFLKRQQEAHNRSLNYRTNFRIPPGHAEKMATKKDKRIIEFAKANGWKPNHDTAS